MTLTMHASLPVEMCHTISYLFDLDNILTLYYDLGNLITSLKYQSNHILCLRVNIVREFMLNQNVY